MNVKKDIAFEAFKVYPARNGGVVVEQLSLSGGSPPFVFESWSRFVDYLQHHPGLVHPGEATVLDWLPEPRTDLSST